MRYFGRVGYGVPAEATPGVYVDGITERLYTGDVLQNTRNLRTEDKVNPDLSVSNQISIVADAFMNDNFMNIRYIEWAGILWTVDNVEVQPPRLLLRLGEVYNGPTSVVTDSP